jgi:hydroxyethylthiazole kinase-like uncharacterized protein yjeF
MELLTTAKQMQGFDRAAIETLGIPGLILMENAGRAVAETACMRWGPLTGKRALVLCGKGNNGGDGFVIARHLLNCGCRVEVALVGKRSEVHGDALSNLSVLERLVRFSKPHLRIDKSSSARTLRRRTRADFIVDAIFGTGFSGAVRDPYRSVIEWVNRQRTPVLAVDIASGVDASTGAVENVAVRAALTVTMGRAKVGHYVGPGCDHSGEVIVADIGIPDYVVRIPLQPVFRVAGSDIAPHLPLRPRTAHKYSAGKVLVIAGSRSFTGAPAMTALASLRSGAGAVILAAPRSIQQVLARKLTEVICLGLEETAEGTISPAAMTALREKFSWADVIALGPGLSRHPDTDRLVLELLQAWGGRLVLDADGLNALAGHAGVLRRRRGETVITPHAGELSRLTGATASQIELDRVASSRGAAKLFGATVMLKGAPTATATRSGTVYVNSTGNPGMATIGSGDVLTGLVAGLLAQGMETVSAAYSGAYLHGLAGDLAATRYGQRGVLASDILEQLPQAIRVTEGQG